MQKFIGLLLALCVAAPMSGQKVLKTLRGYVKDNNTSSAVKELAKLEADSVANKLPRLYNLGKEVQIQLNDAENVKIYLGNAYDTAAFFSSTLAIYDYILKCETQEQRLLAEEGEKMKYHKDNGETLHRYYANLNAGGRYYYSKKNYTTAMKYLRMYLDIPGQAIWGTDKSVTTTRAYVNNVYMYQKCAYVSQSYDEVERYKEVILNDTSAQRRKAIEYFALTAEQQKDTAAFHDYLLLGLEGYPDEGFFFTHLVDYYAERGRYDKVMALAEGVLQRDSTNIVALEAKSLALMNTDKDKEAIEVAKQCLAVDSLLTDAYYYVGAAYCNLALEVMLPMNINTKAYATAATRQKELYAQARPYMEKYRELAPEEKAKWAPLLYRIYFTLNLGTQFEEIDKITQTLQTKE